MRIDKYITNLRNNNIIVTVRDEQLAVHDPDNNLTPEIIEELKINKEEIITFFKSLKRKAPSISIPKTPKREYYPLSFAQKRMYFLYEFNKNRVSYNMPDFYRIGRSLDLTKFDKAVKDLVKRHQSLRTLFDIKNGHPVQKVIEQTEFAVSYKSIASIEIDELVSEFVRPFNLSQEFPYRITLVNVIGEDYLLMIDSHHIINDGVSNKILMRDLWSLYQGDILPAINIQYTDYAIWQESNTYQDLMSKHKKYWLDSYNDDLTTLNLPTDYPRPAHIENQGGIHLFTLTKKQSNELRYLANSHGVTMYTLFLSIYNILLSKLANQEDIVIGTPNAGRLHVDLEGVVGMFVNTLAMRNKVTSDLSFKNFLSKVQENTLSAFDHQLYPYDELVDALNFTRDTSRNPLFDVFFTYAQVEKDFNNNTDTSLSIIGHEVPYTVAKFDLEFDVLDVEEINLRFTYRKDLFAPSSIERFSNYLLRIIEEIIRDKELLIKDIDILSKEERKQLLFSFNNTKKDYDLDQTVLDIFVSQSLLSSDAVAISFKDEQVTYKELNERSDKWAAYLIDNGVRPGSIVGLMMTRSVEMIVGIIAIMKAGGAYLPINTDQPISRTEYMLNDCDVSVILCNILLEFESISSYTCIRTGVLDKAENNHAKLPYTNAKDLAYIIYTSGSTGKPKGVLIQQESITNLIHYEREFLGLDNSDKILQFSPYYFDVSVEQIWSALCTGSCLVLVSQEILTDENRFCSYLQAQEVTHLNVTPSFLERLSLPYLTSLKRILVSGEACNLALAKRYVDEYEFYNEYGPTESTVISVSQKLHPINLTKESVPIGRPIANTQAYILSNDLKLLPQGVSGELYIGGKGLAIGYLNRQDLTDKSFIDNPFGEGKIYKTGDQAKWLMDGTIEFLGRLDNQIMLNGIRIELGEIENHLNTFKGIKVSAVNLCEIENNKSLVAYYVTDDIINKASLKEYLIGKLPLNMLPSFYVELEELPLSANGKLDRRLLPEPEKKERIYEAPSNGIEKQLVLLWSEILQINIENISANDGFFELGGNSLKAISLMNIIFKELSVKITLKEIFVRQTVREISDYIITVNQLKDTEADYKKEVKLLL